jgi:hypothetical protein
MFPTELWSLKKLSDKLLQAKANLYTYSDEKFIRKAYPGYKFLRTGFVGFIIPNGKSQDIYILGSCQDMIQQAHYLGDNAHALHVCDTRWSQTFASHFVNILIGTVLEVIPEIVAW